MDASTNKPSDVDMIAVDDLSQENPHDKEDFELTRDPPSYDSGTLPSEADAKTMMDKIEARTSRMLFTSRMPVLQEWLQANGKARKFQEADQECSLATFPECDEPVASDKKCPRAMTVEIYKKGANMFRDKYGFHPHGEFETELIRIWTKMERAAHKTCPSSRDHTKLKAAFQQYKDANTNWKDILLAYRADKIKEWNQAADVITMAARVGENTMAARDPPSYDSGTLLRRQMRRRRWIISKWLKANGKGKCLKAKAKEVPKHVRKAKATESLQKAHRKRREIRKGKSLCERKEKSLWRARFLAVEKFQQQNLRLPVRNKRATKHEQRLANWLDKAKQRKHRALSSRPSQRQLTPTQAAQLKELFDAQESITGSLLNIIPGILDKAHKGRQNGV